MKGDLGFGCPSGNGRSCDACCRVGYSPRTVLRALAVRQLADAQPNRQVAKNVYRSGVPTNAHSLPSERSDTKTQTHVDWDMVTAWP